MKAKANPFKSAWRAGVPLVAIETADPAQSIRNCIKSLNGKEKTTVLLQWDCVRGAAPVLLQGAGKELASETLSNALGDIDPATLTNGTEFLGIIAGNAAKLCPLAGDEKGTRCRALVFMHHWNRYMGDSGAMQAVWNCRDIFKPFGIMLILLGPIFTIPAELKNDCVTISEPLPDKEQLEVIVASVAGDAGISLESIPDKDRVLDTLTGVSAFGAEQVLAMSITKDGIDQETLTERQRRMIEQTPGLSVWRGGESFDDLGGLANLKEFLTLILKSGNTPVNTVLFADEIEKQFAGIGGDTSGTSGDQFGQMLQFLNDYKIPMMILVGHGGTGKSAIAKATGKIAGCPVLAMDFGAMKGSLVGQSEERIREVIKTAVAVSNGKLILIVTCNKLTVLPPEFKRRATLGTYMVDLPTAEERKRIWSIHIKATGINADQALPEDRDWTGAEIRACCDIAFRTGYTLIQAAKRIVPIAKSNPESIKALRKLAHNSFVSATYDGPYKMPEEIETEPAATGRRFERSE